MTDMSVDAGRRPRPRRSSPTLLASLALLILLGVLAVGIVLTQQQAKSHVQSSFALRGTASAQAVSTYLNEQASREREAANRYLASPRVSPTSLAIVATTLGSAGALVLDDSGHVLATAPATARLQGQLLAPNLPDLGVAEQGQVGVSGIVTSPVTGISATSIAVSFHTPHGTRVISADYPASGLALDALVDHAISYPQHEVYLTDGHGQIIAASPKVFGSTLGAADPWLVTAARQSSNGPVPGATTPTTFTAAGVPGTTWRMLIAVPNSRLYASIAGWTRYIPWVIFGLVTMLGVLIVVLFARLLADRARLSALSRRMERNAQTDSLTGLYNRRALTEHLTRAAARARRHEEPLSVLMIDLDRFKQTNDTYGHDAGDQVLCTVADCLREALRTEDVYGRWGGDEFLVVLPHTEAEGASAAAERLRAAARGVELSEIGLADGISLCVGTATGVHTSPHDLVGEAD
ncbi:MAG TPA: diguanylate cyclase, partial [Solirubrobacteraceae bacterium]|nr:diguanylate cyclase [Solirubrobacteraceae bacterium]